MKTLIALLLTCSSLAAQHYTYVFTNVPLWDVTGSLSISTSYSAITSSVVLHANGQLTGTRTEIDDQNGDHLESSSFIKGRLFSTHSEIVLRDGSRGSYSGVVGGSYVSAIVTVQGSGVLDPISRSVQGYEMTRTCVVGGRCSTLHEVAELPLQTGMDGTWHLDVDLDTTGSKLTGQALLTLSTGRSFSYQVSGTQNVKRGAAILRLKGMYDATPSSLTLYTQGVDQTLVKLRGRLLGQKLKVS